jgi:hypothetical protein
MAQALPFILAGFAGFALVLVLTALWQSMRVVLLGPGARARDGSLPAKTGGPHNPRTDAREALLREKATLLQAIRDVRFEHDLGKISDVDLERLDAQYRLRARAVLAQLDAQIEPYRAKARALLGVAEDGSAAPPESTPVEPAQPAEAAKPEAPAASGATLACGGCATVNDADAVFCKKCGARMSAEAAS